jgi:hypothetical protein
MAWLAVQTGSITMSAVGQHFTRDVATLSMTCRGLQSVPRDLRLSESACLVWAWGKMYNSSKPDSNYMSCSVASTPASPLNTRLAWSGLIW